MKIEKRITKEEVKKAILEVGDGCLPLNDRIENRSSFYTEAITLLNKYQLQTLKDQQVKDAEFEVIQPKQIENEHNKG
jgi:hypothetical protein